MKLSSKIVSVVVAASIGNCLAGSTSTDDESSGVRDTRNDLGIRFNKFEPFNPDSNKAKKFLPLDINDYPISENDKVSALLKEGTTAASVVDVATDYEVIYSVRGLIKKIGGEPDHPTKDDGAPYWGKLKEVVEMRAKKDNESASDELGMKLQLPLRWEGYTVYEFAEAVHDEYPGLHQAEFLVDLVGKGRYGEIDFDNEALSKRSGTRFLRGIVALADLHTWSVGVVAPHNFGAKWYAGRARPEEVAYKIATGEIKREFVPDELFDLITGMGLEKATSFTQYPEGSPMHPSWPAMHSAASNISFWLQVIMNLTPEQLCEAKKVDYAVAYARTVAGVHYPDDNIAGLNMGQEIVSKALPRHLDEKYDSSKSYVRDKGKNKRFDWNDYNPLEDCGSLQ